MRKNTVYAILALTLIWIILMESVSLFTVATGLVLGTICLFFTRKLIPLDKIEDVSFRRLVLYPFYLIYEIYRAGFAVIRMVSKDVRVDTVDVPVTLKSDFLRAVLLNSIVLTPGSCPVGLEGNTMTVLNLAKTTDDNSLEVVDSLRKRLEAQLIKAQK